MRAEAAGRVIRGIISATDPVQPLASLFSEPSLMPDIKNFKPEIWLSVIVWIAACATVFAADSTPLIPATGTFQPDGPPQQQPVRVDAGEGCVVDVDQAYVVDGTLAGSLEVDFRILVFGACGLPPGTFSEEWIARGTFNGSIQGKPATAKFTYTATVESGGEVRGQIVFGQGLDGELRIRGRFSDGKLTYEGQLTAIEQK